MSIGIVIPANTQFPDEMFFSLCEWLTLSGIDPNQLDGTKPIYITGEMITAATVSGAVQGPPRAQFPAGLFTWLSTQGWIVEDLVHPNIQDIAPQQPEPEAPPTELPLDDMAQLIEQLRKGRELEREAKALIEEARDQILARLRTEVADIGTVGGRPAVQWKQLKPRKFDVARFKAAGYADLYEQFRFEKPENRLELL